MVTMIDTDEKAMLFHLSLQRVQLENQLKDCIGDMERLEVNRQLEVVNAEIANLVR